MNAVRKALAELAGLFVEDRLFALAIALWVGAAGAGARFLPGTPVAIVFFAGLLVVLVAGAVRGARGVR